MESIRKREYRKFYLLSWLAIGLLLTVIGVVVTLQHNRLDYLEQSQQITRDLARVRADINKGYLHLLLSSPESPWQRAQGVALIRQSISLLDSTLLRLGDDSATGDLLQRQKHLAGELQSLLSGQEVWPVEQFKLAMYHQTNDLDALYRAIRTTMDVHAERLTLHFRQAIGAALGLCCMIGLLLWKLNRDRLRVDMALLETQRRLNEITSNLSDVFWMVDVASGDLVYISPSCEQVFGVPVTAFHENSSLCLGLVHPEDRERVEKLYEQAMDEAALEYDTLFRIMKGSEVRWLHETAKPIADSTGAVTRLAGVVRDVTDLCQLNQRHLLLRQTVDNSPDVVLLVEHREGGTDLVVYANGAVAGFHGCTPDRLVGCCLSDVISELWTSDLCGRFDAALKSRSVASFEIEVANGTSVRSVFEVTIIPIPGQLGGLLAFNPESARYHPAADVGKAASPDAADGVYRATDWRNRP